MDTSPDLLLSAAWLALKVIFIGTFGLYLVTLGNPCELYAQVRIVRYLNAAPPTAVFRWRNPEGYEVAIYNAATDEDEVKPALFEPVRWSPTFLLWPKKGPQPKNVMVRTASLTYLMRLVFFICFFLGSFFLLTWLAVSESRLWFIAMGVVAVHQLAFAFSQRHVRWLRGWLYVVIGSGAWVYLQGGAFETFAVCTVGALVVIAILGQWYMAKNWRFQHMRDLGRWGMGPFAENRRRRPW